MSVVVPFVRPLYPGAPLEQGKDVTAVQRALRDAGALTKAVTTASYAENTWKAVTAFQHENGIHATGAYGKATHAKLAPHFDPYGRWLLVQGIHDLKPDPREQVVQTAYWYYGQRLKIAYNKARAILTVYYGIEPPEAPKYLDCSGLAITTYWANGLAHFLGDENAHGFGNTWSLARHGKSVSIADLRPGDLVFYYESCSHVAVYVGNGRVISNGHYPMGLYAVGYAPIWGCRSYLP